MSIVPRSPGPFDREWRAAEDRAARLARRIRELEAERDTAKARADALEGALLKINEIRNSIIGFHTVNWSEHIYPLVTALDEAGIKGLEYPEARDHFGTFIERNEDLAREVERLREAILRTSQRANETGTGEAAAIGTIRDMYAMLATALEAKTDD